MKQDRNIKHNISSVCELTVDKTAHSVSTSCHIQILQCSNTVRSNYIQEHRCRASCALQVKPNYSFNEKYVFHHLSMETRKLTIYNWLSCSSVITRQQVYLMSICLIPYISNAFFLFHYLSLPRCTHPARSEGRTAGFQSVAWWCWGWGRRLRCKNPHTGSLGRAPGQTSPPSTPGDLASVRPAQTLGGALPCCLQRNHTTEILVVFLPHSLEHMGVFP